MASFRVYRSYEEFEREELRSDGSFGHAVENLMDTELLEELDFDGGKVRGRRNEELEEADDEGE